MCIYKVDRLNEEGAGAPEIFGANFEEIRAPEALERSGAFGVPNFCNFVVAPELSGASGAHKNLGSGVSSAVKFGAPENTGNFWLPGTLLLNDIVNQLFSGLQNI